MFGWWLLKVLELLADNYWAEDFGSCWTPSWLITIEGVGPRGWLMIINEGVGSLGWWLLKVRNVLVDDYWRCWASWLMLMRVEVATNVWYRLNRRWSAWRRDLKGNVSWKQVHHTYCRWGTMLQVLGTWGGSEIDAFKCLFFFIVKIEIRYWSKSKSKFCKTFGQ